VIGVLATAPGPSLTLDQRVQLETFVSKTALALERALLAAEAERSRLAVETERQRSELLSAVSHDLRTPLASITGAATALVDQLEGSQRELLLTVREESNRLGRLVADLLDLTRIESGALRAKREWSPIEEVVSGAIDRVEPLLAGRTVHVDVPDEVLLAPMDPTLIEQVLVNLLENAAKYSPAGTAIDVVARAEPDAVRVEVADRGPGIPPGEVYRAADGQRARGTGLGLAICRAILRAHGGRIEAADREGGGAVFRFWLLVDRPSPA
jgi:two-component system sensor histidine kinase KdpD